MGSSEEFSRHDLLYKGFGLLHLDGLEQGSFYDVVTVEDLVENTVFLSWHVFKT